VKAVDNEFMAFLADRRALSLLQSITPQIERDGTDAEKHAM